MVTLALVLPACEATATQQSSVPAGSPHPGQTLWLGLPSDPNCLDPQQTGVTASLSIGRQLVDSLTDQDPRTAAIRPWLATNWEVSPDGRSFTFQLRPGATFSDGSPVDAEAVKTNFDAIVRLGARSQVGSTYLKGYAGTTVLGPYRFRVDFTVPTAQFLQATSTVSLGLLSPSAFTVSPEQRCQGTRLIGSGPFVLADYTANESVTLRKRKDYAWPSSLARHAGAAYLDELKFSIIPESGVRAGALLSGELDAATDIQPHDESVFDGNGFHLLTRPNPGIPLTLLPNVTRSGLRDRRVRRAIQHAVNRQQLVDVALSPRYRPATGMLASSTPFFVDQSDELRFNPVAAKRLLDEAGWRPGQNGIRTKNGQRLVFDVIFGPTFGPSRNILVLIQQQLREIGIKLRLRQLTVGEAIATQARGDFDFTLVSLTRADPDVLRMTFSTKSRNPCRLPPSPLDDMLSRQAAAIDPQQRAAAVTDVLNNLATRAVAVPLIELNQVVATNEATHGLHFESASRLQLYDTWKSSQKGS